jgi:hypothetical protein
MSTIVTRAGKGSELTHNEVDSNFTNLNTDKLETSRFPNVNGNVTSTDEELNILTGATLSVAELNILDGVTASTAELNIVDGVTVSAAQINNAAATTSSTAELNILDGVTSTAAELNKTDDSAAAVAGFVSGMRTYLNADGGSATTFDLVGPLTESSFESIGPTGSSATNIWTAMDAMPAAATTAIILISASATPSTDTRLVIQVSARQTGSSATGAGPSILSYAVHADDFNTGVAAISTVVLVPLDGSRRFDMMYSASGDNGPSILLTLKGFIV